MVCKSTRESVTPSNDGSGRNMIALDNEIDAETSQLIVTTQNAPVYSTRVMLADILCHLVENGLPDRPAAHAGRTTAPTPKHPRLIDESERGDFTRPIRAPAWNSSAVRERRT